MFIIYIYEYKYAASRECCSALAQYTVGEIVHLLQEFVQKPVSNCALVGWGVACAGTTCDCLDHVDEIRGADCRERLKSGIALDFLLSLECFLILE